MKEEVIEKVVNSLTWVVQRVCKGLCFGKK